MNPSSDDRLAVFRRKKELLAKSSTPPSDLNMDTSGGQLVSMECTDNLSQNEESPVAHSPNTEDAHSAQNGFADLCVCCQAKDTTTFAMHGLAAPLSLGVIYLSQRETSERLSLVSAEQSDFVSNLVWPFLKGCERLMKLAVYEATVLRQKLVSSRRDAQVCSSPSDEKNRHNTSESSVLTVLRQQLADQRARHGQELERAQQRREREHTLMREGYERQISCLEGQVALLKQRIESDAVRSTRIDSDIVGIGRSLPRESSPPSAVDITATRNRALQLRRSQLVAPISPPREQGAVEYACVPSQQRNKAHSTFTQRACCSLNPRHSTVVASFDGSSWRSIYLVVTAEGECCFSESISDAVTHLLYLNEVTSVKMGNSKHSQRPLLLSVAYMGGHRQLDIALADKSERESWRQAFRYKGCTPITREESEEIASPTSLSRGAFETAQRINTADSLASTPSISSANPMPSDQENPSLNRWLESQADNVRGGHLDPDGNFITSQEVEDYNKISGGADILKRCLATSSPVASRPPLASSVVKEPGATTSTSSRDRLPPLAPQHKRRSTISGSASTADSLTEDEAVVEHTPAVALLSSHFDDPIAPVSPSHSSDGGASPPTSEEDSINLSPELSPLDFIGSR